MRFGCRELGGGSRPEVSRQRPPWPLPHPGPRPFRGFHPCCEGERTRQRRFIWEASLAGVPCGRGGYRGRAMISGVARRGERTAPRIPSGAKPWGGPDAMPRDAAALDRTSDPATDVLVRELRLLLEQARTDATTWRQAWETQVAQQRQLAAPQPKGWWRWLRSTA